MRLNINNYNRILGEKGLKNDEVCKRTGLSEKSLNWILQNQYLEVSTLERIAEAIGCSPKEIYLPDYADVTENVIEWEKDSGQATVTLSQRGMISKIRKLAETKPNECQIVAEYKENTIVAHIPRKWIKISPPREVSEEFRQQAGERLNKFKARKQDIED